MPSIYRCLSFGKGIVSSGLILFTWVHVEAAAIDDLPVHTASAKVDPAGIEYQLKEELITWLSLNSQTAKAEIEERLKLNRNLEKKTCSERINFLYATSTKRMIKAECTNVWRRYIKRPSWVNVKISTPTEVKAESNKIVDAFILRRDIKKDEVITSYDLIRKTINVELTAGLLMEYDEAIPMIATRKLRSGESLSVKDVLIGEVVLIAKTTIPSGSSLTNEIISLDTRYSNIPEDALTKAEGWDFMELNRNIIAGEILRQRHLRKAKLVRRNDPVTITIRNSSLEIVTSGTSLQDGYYGQRIKVINLESGRSILGKVIGRGEVEVNTK